MIIQRVTENRIRKNSTLFAGLILVVLGAYMLIDHLSNSEYQDAKTTLEQNEKYSRIVSFTDNLILGGFLTMILGGGFITIIGYLIRGLYDDEN